MKIDFLKGVFWVFLFKILGASSLLFINFLLSNYWGIESVGEFGILTSSLMMASLLSKVGLDTYIIKFASRIESEDVYILFFKVLVITGFTSFTVGLFYVYLTGEISVLILVILFSLFSVLPEFIRALGSSFNYSLIRGFSLNFFVFSILVFLILIDVKPNFHLVYFIAITLSLMLFCICYKNLDGNITVHRISFDDLKAVFNETVFMQVSALSIYFLGNFSVLILSFYYDAEVVGKYYIVLQMTLIFNLVITSVGIYVGPKLSRSASEFNWNGFKKTYLTSSVLCSVLLFPFIVIYYLFGDLILFYFFDISDENTHKILIVMSLGYYLTSILGPKFSAFNMTGNHKQLSYVMLFFLAFGLLSNFIFAKFGSLSHFVYSSTFVNVTLSMFCCLYVFRFIIKSTTHKLSKNDD